MPGQNSPETRALCAPPTARLRTGCFEWLSTASWSRWVLFFRSWKSWTWMFFRQIHKAIKPVCGDISPARCAGEQAAGKLPCLNLVGAHMDRGPCALRVGPGYSLHSPAVSQISPCSQNRGCFLTNQSYAWALWRPRITNLESGTSRRLCACVLGRWPVPGSRLMQPNAAPP
jgi:hypothetical protein